MPTSAATGRQATGTTQIAMISVPMSSGSWCSIPTTRASTAHSGATKTQSTAVLASEQPADHGAVTPGRQDTDPVRGEHVRRRDVGVHPAGQDDGESERALQREQPAAGQQEPRAGHEQPVDRDHDGHLVGRAERLSHLGGDCGPEGAGHDRAPVPLALREPCQRRPCSPPTRRRSADWRPCHGHPRVRRAAQVTPLPHWRGLSANHPALRHDACSLAVGQSALVHAGPRASKWLRSAPLRDHDWPGEPVARAAALW